MVRRGEEEEEEDRDSRDLHTVEVGRSHDAGNRRDKAGNDSLEEAARGSDLRGISDYPVKANRNARDNVEDCGIESVRGADQAISTTSDCVDDGDGGRCRDHRGHEAERRSAVPRRDLDTKTY